MKTLIFKILFVMASFILIGAYFANAANLKWDASEGAAGYIVYYGMEEGVYSYNSDVGDITLLHDMDISLNLHVGVTYYLVVVAYNASGPSPYSNEVNYTQEAYNPPGDKLPSAVIHIPGPSILIIE